MVPQKENINYRSTFANITKNVVSQKFPQVLQFLQWKGIYCHSYTQCIRNVLRSYFSLFGLVPLFNSFTLSSISFGPDTCDWDVWNTWTGKTLYIYGKLTLCTVTCTMPKHDCSLPLEDCTHAALYILGLSKFTAL